MTDDEVLARMARRIEELSDELANLQGSCRKAISYIVCIGGPLNDNKLKYTNEQLKVFTAILSELE